MTETNMSEKDYGTLLAENAGSLGIGGELLESIRSSLRGKDQEKKEAVPFGVEHAKKIVARGIAMRSSRPDNLAKELDEGIWGDALATYNLGHYTDKRVKNRDLQDQVIDGSEDLSTLRVNKYLDAINRHFKNSLVGDLGSVFNREHTFNYVFSDPDRLLGLLPVIHILELGQYPPTPYDLDRYFVLGKIGSSTYFPPEKIDFTASLTKSELEAIWREVKEKIGGVKLVDEASAEKYWGQDVLFDALITKYLEKITARLDEITMPVYANE